MYRTQLGYSTCFCDTFSQGAVDGRATKVSSEALYSKDLKTGSEPSGGGVYSSACASGVQSGGVGRAVWCSLAPSRGGVHASCS